MSPAIGTRVPSATNLAPSPTLVIVIKEATIRDFLPNPASAKALAGDARNAMESSGGSDRRLLVDDWLEGESHTISAPMMIRLCDAVLDGDLPATALEPLALAVLLSDHLEADPDDDVVARVLNEWAAPVLTGLPTTAAVRAYRAWLTRQASPPSEPEVTPDTLTEWRIVPSTIKSRRRCPLRPW